MPSKSIALKKDDVGKLCDIVEKTTEGDPHGFLTLILSGRDKSVTSQSSEGLLTASWPREVDKVSLEAWSPKNDRQIDIHFHNGIVPYNSIEITATDRDWVASRTKEVEEFIADHRNNHWMFNYIALPALQGSLLVGLPAYRLLKLTSGSKLGPLVIVCAVILFEVYVWGMGKLFPFAFIDTERPSILAGLRKVVKYAVPLVIVGLIIEFMIRLLFS